MRIPPLAKTQVVEEVFPTPGAQGIRTQRLALLLEATPEVDQRCEVRIRVLPLRMRLVGLLLAVRRTLAHVLHRQRAGDDQHLGQAAQLRRLKQHAPETRIDGQTRQLPAQRGQLVLAIDRRKLLQQVEAIADGLAVRRFDEGEILDLTKAQMQHLKDDRSEVGAQDLRIGEFRPTEEILFAVQANADPGLDPPATALALVGAGLGHRLDRQPLHLGSVAVTADPRRARINDVADAGYGQRGFRDVGGEHDLAARPRLENLLLLGRRQPCIQRQYLGEFQVGLAQHLRRVANLALAGQEHQHVAGALADALFMGVDLVQRRKNALINGEVVLDAVAVFVDFRRQRAIPGLDRIGTARHFDDGRPRTAGPAEMLGEALQVDGCGGNDHLQVGTARQQGLEVAEQEVDVEATLVGLVDDDGVVFFQEAVVLRFGQQDAVGHQFDQRAVLALVFEAHLITHQLTQRRADLLGHARGDAARRQPARLGVADQPVHTASDFQADLRQLRGLARAGFTGDHQHLMLFQRGLDLIALGGNRQAVVVAHYRHTPAPRLDLGHRCLETLKPLGEAFGVDRRIAGLLAQVVQLTAQAMAVSEHRLVEVFQELFKRGRCVGHGQPYAIS